MSHEPSSGGADELSRAAVDVMKGPVMLEFGASWCSHCKAAEPLVAAARAEYPNVRFVWVEDGKGKPLGRSFGVKLWPTLLFLRDGQECERLVRPEEVDLIEQALAKISAG